MVKFVIHCADNVTERLFSFDWLRDLSNLMGLKKLLFACQFKKRSRFLFNLKNKLVLLRFLKICELNLLSLRRPNENQ